MATRPISVRLPDAMLDAMDRCLATTAPTTAVRTRTDLIQAAIDMWLAADEAARVDASIAAGYTRFPVGSDEEEFGRISDQAQAELDPW